MSNTILNVNALSAGYGKKEIIAADMFVNEDYIQNYMLCLHDVQLIVNTDV